DGLACALHEHGHARYDDDDVEVFGAGHAALRGYPHLDGQPGPGNRPLGIGPSVGRRSGRYGGPEPDGGIVRLCRFVWRTDFGRQAFALRADCYGRPGRLRLERPRWCRLFRVGRQLRDPLGRVTDYAAGV
ncbi:uncharacterized protein METZ01_LOCUS391031, partial [marine metagenome]